MCNMKMLTKTAIFIICTLVVCSILVASILNAIQIDYEHYATQSGIQKARNRTRRLRGQYGIIQDSPHNIMWFLQISDIHISIFRDHGRITQFQQFCDHTVKKISPHVVLATGDLTDAKAKNNMGSAQVQMEWVYYKNIIKESGVTDTTMWLDIRGNHDNFNVRDVNSKNNYYSRYSVQGVTHPRSYIYQDIFNGVDVAFLGIDACPKPGLRRPFNFIGLLDNAEVNQIEQLQEIANKANHTIWFGHYPTSCILWLSEKDGSVRELIGRTDSSTAYLCGHLHTMGGLVPHMYTMHKSQYLELELSDWKDNRIFRLAAIDHGMFSFVDQKHNDWPLVLVTNPKHARYALPEREPLDIVATSSHVRLLAFSNVEISQVKISIDNGQWTTCYNVKGPIYACRWKPQQYLSGLHNLKVIVLDSENKKKEMIVPFALDDSKLQYDVYARILLMSHGSTVFQSVFATFLCISVLPIICMRFQRTPPQCRTFCSYFFRKLWILSRIDKLYYPIVLYSIYLPLGPWSIGELIDGHIGAIFAWGIIIDSSFLPGSFTYVYGSIQLLFIHIPLILVLASCVDRRMSSHRALGLKKVTTHLPFILLLSFQMLLAYFFWLAYGTMAFIFGPLRTWSIFLNMILWYQALTLPNEFCRKLENMLLPVVSCSEARMNK